MKKLSESFENVMVEFGKPIRDDYSKYERYFLPIILNGVEYPTDVLRFTYDVIESPNKTLYKVDIRLNPEFQKKGIGYQIYKKFLMEYGNIVSPISYRSNHVAIPKIYDKLEKEPGITRIKDPDYDFVCTEEWKSKYGTKFIYGILKKDPRQYILDL